MTDFHTKPTRIDEAIYLALSSRHGRTALEVWNRCPGYPFKVVRDRLKSMAKEEDIDCKVTTADGRSVREYRAWR